MKIRIRKIPDLYLRNMIDMKYTEKIEIMSQDQTREMKIVDK